MLSTNQLLHFSEIKSWYAHDLNLTNIPKYIINTLEELESSTYFTRLETSNRFIDAIQVLVDYLIQSYDLELIII